MSTLQGLSAFLRAQAGTLTSADALTLWQWARAVDDLQSAHLEATRALREQMASQDARIAELEKALAAATRAANG